MNRPYIWVMTAEYAPLLIGGLGTVATQLTRSLIASDVDIDIISVGHFYKKQKKKQHTILRLPKSVSTMNTRKKSFKPQYVLRAAKRTFPRKPNIIHVHSMEFAEAAIALKLTYRIPLVYTCHSLVSLEKNHAPVRRLMQGKLLRQATRIIVPSQWLKSEISRRYPGTAHKIQVIPHGVPFVAKQSQAPPHKLLFVGRILNNKGIESLILALPTLAKKNSKTSLTIVGKGAPHYVYYLKSLARKNKVLSRIRWLGSLPHNRVQRLYRSYGAVIVPSKQESFCLVALEAMAHGVPLVSSDKGGLKEFVTAQNAQIIPLIKSKSIGQAIVSMWSHPSKTRERVMAAQYVARKYSWRYIARLYKQMFVNLS